MGASDLCDPEVDEWCIVDGIEDQVAEGGLENLYTHTFTLPNVDCDNCTIQVIQNTFVNYFQCADIVITAQDDTMPEDGTGGSEATDGAGGASMDGDPLVGSGGMTTTGGTGGMQDDPPGDSDADDGASSSKGCTYSPRSGGPWDRLALLLLGVPLLLFRRQRAHGLRG
jgi:hypothetical protein